MPAQSGSTAVLGRMRRGYTRAAYDALLRRVRKHIPQARWDMGDMHFYADKTSV